MILQRKIRDFMDEFEQLGEVGFENRPLPSGQKQKIYFLNEPQATFLLTLLRDSRQVVRHPKTKVLRLAG
ncbi:hypothetical protein Psch_02211 [Pelotomaculum schinkii]|uniref:Uncharacterized protein n=1 Tax=Pelotomaculum schinkii TaxID=78350 RepID=A0A4Y7RI43_9FIRM|nr:hypothetical protein [Pelotomaculum schinkii]TEB08645.1 hypothetical protein Psch_02211 [Pelotomaculum schinkii]